MIFKKLLRTKKSKKDLNEMSKKEKKQFLSMDLVERMIRVEQRVAASFGEHIHYNKTEYYKSLTAHEKKRFEQYLKRRGTRKFFMWGFLLLVLLSPVFLRIRFSGQVIGENLQIPVSLVDKVLVFFVLSFIGVLLVLFILNKAKKRKFEKYFEIIDRVAVKNYGVK